MKDKSKTLISISISVGLIASFIFILSMRHDGIVTIPLKLPQLESEEEEMFLKKGVKIQGISNEMLLGLFVADQVYQEHGYELTITSVIDGRHSKTSLHYSGNGGDLRTRDIPEDDREPIRASIKERLGIDFDVILESDHIHMEYQPRG